MPYKSNTRKIFAAFLLVCLFCGPASAGTVTGQIFLGSSGTALKDGNLTFTASQLAIQSGTGLIVNAPITCATDASGNVVGIHKPTPAPTVTPNTASGTLPPGTYFTRLVLLDGTGHTLPSDETTTVLSSTGSLIISPPATVGHATQWAVYISTSSGTETLQSTLTGFAANYTQSSALTAGSALPVSNTTTCTFPFTDELVPTGTNYSVNLTSSAGAQYAGFPTKAQFYGGANGSVNVSSGFPAASNFILYPTPIVSSPANSATQSINGSLSLNGFSLLGLGALISNSSNPAGSGLVELANTDKGDCWRNAANSNDVCLSDAGAAGAGTGNLADLLAWSGGGFQGGAFVDQSANPARSGVVRTGNNVCAVASRNAANSADVCAVQVDGSNVTNVGGSAGTKFGGPATLNGTTPYNRLRANQGTALTSGAFTLGSGWGTTATVSTVAGTDSAFTFSITSNGTGQAANPTVTITFADGTFTNPPVVLATFGPVSTGSPAPWVITNLSATSVQFEMNTAVAPTAGLVYSGQVICIGR